MLRVVILALILLGSIPSAHAEPIERQQVVKETETKKEFDDSVPAIVSPPSKIDIEIQETPTSSHADLEKRTANLEHHILNLKHHTLSNDRDDVDTWLTIVLAIQGFLLILIAMFGIIASVNSYQTKKEIGKIRTRAEESVERIEAHESEAKQKAQDISDFTSSMKEQVAPIKVEEFDADRNIENNNMIPSQEIKAEELFIEGNKALEDGEFILATEKYRASLDELPNSISALNNLGVVLLSMGEPIEAIENFTKALSFNENDSESLINRALAYQSLGEHSKAIQDYSKVIELNPENYDSYNNRGGVRSLLGMVFDALNDYDKAIEIDPSRPHAYNNRGGVKASLGRFQEAVNDFSSAIEKNPIYWQAYHNRGVARTELNTPEIGKAIEDMEKALELARKQNSPDVKDVLERLKALKRMAGT